MCGSRQWIKTYGVVLKSSLVRWVGVWRDDSDDDDNDDNDDGDDDCNGDDDDGNDDNGDDDDGNDDLNISFYWCALIIN